MIKITSLIGYRKGENVNACIMQLLHSSCQYNRVGVCTKEAAHDDQLAWVNDIDPQVRCFTSLVPRPEGLCTRLVLH